MTHHVMSHSEEKVFACDYCGFESNASSTVIAHTEREHPREELVYMDRRPMLEASLAAKVRQCFPAKAYSPALE